MSDGTPLDELTIKLRKSVTIGGMTYDELKLREPTASEWTQWDRLEGVAADIKAVAIVSAVPEAAVGMIGARDLVQAGRYIASFLG